MACRFPGADNPRTFWRNLCNGVESTRFFDRDELLFAGVTPADLDHPHYVRAAPVIDHHDAFDAGFFEYSPREASLIDPQQRHFLEVAWETLESAGFDPLNVRGSVGVYAGAGGLVSSQIVRNAHPELRGQTGDLGHIGNDRDFLCSRVSFKLNLHGPSVNIQTACSTSLVAVHLACQSLLVGETDMALAGASVVRIPHLAGYFAQPGNIYSPDGHCRAFDAQAGGTLFGSGVAAILLKPLDRALADGNYIHAVIRGTAVNNDGGGKVNFTASAAKAQASAMAEAITVADADPHDIAFVECHGTATAIGDPIEIQALSRAFKATGAKDIGYCAIGSVKTNFGHLEQCAGLAGLIKAALCVEHGQVPPTLHYRNPNPRIPFENSPFYVCDRLQELSGKGPVLQAAVNSVGMGGTNAFALLERAPEGSVQGFRPRRRQDSQAAFGERRRPFVLAISAPNTPGIARQLYCHRVGIAALRTETGNDVDQALSNYCASANRLSHAHAARSIAIADAASGLERELERLIGSLSAAPHSPDRPRPGPVREQGSVFIFSGQGPQHPGMGRMLYDSEPVFRARLDEAVDGFETRGIGLRDVLFGSDPVASTNTLYAQCGLYALQEALVSQWACWGWRPNAVIGHSVGEFAAARVAGALDFEQALDLVAARARLMAALPPRGKMIAVAANREEVASYWPVGKVQMALASDNSPSSVVVSGAVTPVQKLCAALSAAGITWRQLAVSHAFHSPLMRSAADEFQRISAQQRADAPSITWYSTLTGQAQRAAPDGGYWGRQIAAPVQFRAAVEAAAEHCDTFLEVGPDGSFAQLARQTLEHVIDEKQPCTVIASLAGVQSTSSTPYAALGEYWKTGGQIAWETLEPWNGERSKWLPTYPFERRPWQLGDGAERTKATTVDDDRALSENEIESRFNHHPMLPNIPLGGVAAANEPVSYEILLDLEVFDFLKDHRVQGRVVLPTTVLLELGHIVALRHGKGPIPIIHALFHERAVELPEDEPCWLRLSLRHDQLVFETAYGAADGAWIRNASAIVGTTDKVGTYTAGDFSAIKAVASRIDADSHYETLAADGLHYGPRFRGHRDIWSSDGEVLSEVDSLPGSNDGYLLHPAFLDACLHAYSLLVPSTQTLQSAGEQRTWVPLSIERFEGRASAQTKAWVRANRRASDDPMRHIIDITVLDRHGQLVALIEGLTVGALSHVELFPQRERSPAGRYRTAWELLPELKPLAQQPSSWVVQGGTPEQRNALGRQLERLGATVGENLRVAIEVQRPDAQLGIAILASRTDLTSPIAYGELLELLQTIPQLTTAHHRTLVRVWLITHGAQTAGHGVLGNPERAAVWGLGRTFALEFPQFWGGLVDLPALHGCRVDATDSDTEGLMAALARELTANAGEDQLCLAKHGRRALRLITETAWAHGPTDPEAPLLRKDAVYWITGGTGSLGLRAAAELVAMGAQHLLLTNRRGETGLDEDSRGRLKTLRNGVEVLVAPCDVTSRSDIETMLSQLDDRGLALGGILHAAAVFDAAVVENLSSKDLNRAMDVKFHGARRLHELTMDRPLEFFVLYSSVLSLWGGAGQAAYVAANSALDALAEFRHALGLPATVINWGPWKGSRAGTLGGQAGAAMWRARATEALDDEHYLPVLRQAVQPGDVTQIMACATDWERFAAQFIRLPPLFAELCPHAFVSRSDLTPISFATGAAGIAQVAGDLLGFDGPVEVDRPLTELGLDSLLAVNLANRLRESLDLSIPTAALLKGATVADLAALGGVAEQGPADGGSTEPAGLLQSQAPKVSGDGWLIYPAPRPDAQVRVLCFPFAGGGAGTFRTWADRLALEIELVAIEPPGRQSRIDEAPLRRIEDYVDQLLPHLLPLADKPMAVYGHCLGALTMYETVCALVQEHQICPVHAFVSGARPPDQIKRPQSFEFDLLERLIKIPEFSVFEPVHDQADIVFGEVIKEFNILATTEMLAFEELRRLLLPLIRAEFEMSSNYQFQNRPRWQFPLTCLHGTRDTYATEANARAWGRFTDKRFELLLSDSEHFLVVDEDQYVIDTINNALVGGGATAT